MILAKVAFTARGSVRSTGFANALSPALAQAGYIYPNTPLSIEPQFHLRSDPTARPFDISFSPDPTSSHVCPYTTIGADINITGSPSPPKNITTEDILNTITANADNNLQRHERSKLGRMHKPHTTTSPDHAPEDEGGGGDRIPPRCYGR